MTHALTHEQFFEDYIVTPTEFDARQALGEPIDSDKVHPIIPSKTAAEALLKRYASQSSYIPSLLERIILTAERANWSISKFNFLESERTYFLLHPHTTFDMNYSAFLILHILSIISAPTTSADDSPLFSYKSRKNIDSELEYFLSANVELIRSQPAKYQPDMAERLVSAISHLIEANELRTFKTSRALQRQLLLAIGSQAHKALGDKFDSGVVKISASDDEYALFDALHNEPPTSAKEPSLRRIDKYMSDFKVMKVNHKVRSATKQMGIFDGTIISAHIARCWPEKSIALLSKKVRVRILLDVIAFADYSSANGDWKSPLLDEKFRENEKLMFFWNTRLPAGTDFNEIMLKFGNDLDLLTDILSGWVNKSTGKYRWAWRSLLKMASSVCVRMDRADLVSRLKIVEDSIVDSAD